MRRTSRDPDRTREKILVQAMAEFAAKGYDGARVDTVARRCRLSKNMLYHYYGNKEGLYVAVLERMYETFRARQRDFALGPDDPVEAMRQLIAHTFSALLEHPEVIALLNNENLYKGRHVQRSQRIRGLYDPLVDKIGDVLQRGAADGIFRQNIDPVILYMSLSSMAYHYISNQYTFRAIFGFDFLSEKQCNIWLVHITEMILAFCRATTNAQPAELIAEA